MAVGEGSVNLGKKSEADLTASILKKIQNTQEIKRMLFNWTKLEKICTFLRKSSVSSYVQHKKQKNKQLIQLILCQLN